jgi:hypothetical protein
VNRTPGPTREVRLGLELRLREDPLLEGSGASGEKDAGAALVDGAAGSPYPLDRQREVEERAGWVPREILDRDPGEPRSAGKPRPASTRALPTSQGLGMTKQPDSWS